MAHSYHRLYYHLIFGVKHRRSVLSTEIRPKLFAYMAGNIQGCDGHAIIINGVSDHIHLLLSLGPKFPLADIVRDVKACSSKHINESNWFPQRFEWQGGYSIFTVSYSGLNDVKSYIANQESRHTQMTFAEEYRQFLDKHGVSYDPRFVMEEEFLG